MRNKKTIERLGLVKSVVYMGNRPLKKERIDRRKGIMGVWEGVERAKS